MEILETTRRTYRHPVLCVLAVLVLGLSPHVSSAQDAALREIVDARIGAAWQAQGIIPSSPSSDGEFLRRIWLDLAGIIPTYAETAAFLADESVDKRPRLIDRLLDDPRYAQHQADLWDLILFGRNPPGYGTDQREGFQRWLRQQFAANRPYDEWVRELLQAEGNSVEQGTPLYYVQYRGQPEDLTEVVTQTFLGVQLQCARCHDHPFEPWKQRDFYGMAAFFARLEIAEVGSKDNRTLYALAERSTGEVLFTGPVSEQRPGQEGEPVDPRFLAGERLVEPALPEGFEEPQVEPGTLPPLPFFSRKERLVDWLTRPENPYFARAIANRLWAQLMGRGLVHPVDNLSASNPPSHPELLDSLASWLVENRFEVKGYLRELANSRTYQLSAAPRATAGAADTAVEEAHPQWFQHARWRPLSAEELIESWRVASGYDDAVAAQPTNQGDETVEPPDRFRPLTRDYLLMFFGQPNDGMGYFQGGLNEHLYLNNGELDRLIVDASGGLWYELMREDLSWENRVERLFLQTVNRPPRPGERERLVALFSSDPEPGGRLRQAIWALMTSSEFRFNH